MDAAQRARARRDLFTMVALVVVIDGLAIGAHRVFHLEQASQTVRVAFTAGWTLATLLVIMPYLRRIRAAVRPPRAGSRGESRSR